MRVPLGWLREHVDVDLPVERLTHLLDMSGTKVVAVHRPGEGVKGIVVAEVLGIEQHPDADSLTLVDVRADGEPQRVVCGARNFAVGDRVPFARVGASLPAMEIGRRKIRGQVSDGMLCSAAELGVATDHSGILVLPPDAEPGSDVVATLGLEDPVLELEITPNRPDCMSVIGIAREVAALTGTTSRLPRPRIGGMGEGEEGDLAVEIWDAEGCPRYLGRSVEGVTIGASPTQIAARLLAAGLRPISNVVDATNYVMLEMGQPLHAFDAQQITDSHIIVRRAREEEPFTTLDGVSRTLDERDLVIADPERALALAGVMGGGDSEVTPGTRSLVLESAAFDKVSVAFTSRRHGIRTEASARFERGMDPEMVAIAADRAVELILQTAGGRVGGPPVDEYPSPYRRPRITLRPQRTGRLLGIDIPPERQARHLEAIGLRVGRGPAALDVEVPGFRPDLTREEDLVEEVARLEGLDKLPATLPGGRAGTLGRAAASERRLRLILSGLGLSEVWTSSFMAEDVPDRLEVDEEHPARRVVRVANPMSEAEAVLRTTIMPGLLGSAAYNLARGARGLAFYEIAHVYEPGPGEGKDQPVREPLVLAAVFTGECRPKTWRDEAASWDLFEVKGILEAALASLGVPGARFRQGRGMPFHPTRAAVVTVGEAVAGVLGELHPEVCDRFEVPGGTVAAEIALVPLFDALPGRVEVRDIPRFPANLIDIALVVDEGLPVDRVTELIWKAGSPQVTDVRLFDLYRGDQVKEGKKSVAFSLELRAPDGTLTEEAAARVRDRIVAVLRERTGAELRS